MEIYHANSNLTLIENETLAKKKILCMKSTEILKGIIEPSWIDSTQEAHGT
jgi:hypothetical protein